MRIQIKTTTPEATLELGEALGQDLNAGDIVALMGDLGTGKTLLAKGLARGTDVPKKYYITSPTYTIINEYPGRIPFYHFDLYRLEGDSCLEGLGYEEYFNGRGVSIIEWAEKIAPLLPEERIEIHISYLEKNTRGFEITGFGDHYEKIICRMAHIFE